MESTLQTSQLQSVIEAMRAAQMRWDKLGLKQRLKIIGRLSRLIAEHAEELAGDVVRPVAVSTGEILASELLPLADASRYVARRGAQVLRSHRLPRRDGAWWMGSIRVCQTRQPLGVVLLIGPSNYPLLLPGVQLVQALAAGNAVLIKPAPACASVIERLVRLCILAGVPNDLLHVLPTEPDAAMGAIDIGIDKVVLTGSYETGQAVARKLAESLTPGAFELSGNDAVFVLDDADLERVAKSVVYALNLNGGQTCIAPRRLFATGASLRRLLPLLQREVERHRAAAVPRSIGSDPDSAPSRDIAKVEPGVRSSWEHPGVSKTVRKAREAIDEALASGAQLVCGDVAGLAWPGTPLPLVLAGVLPQMRVATEDLFVPVLSLIEVGDMDEALERSKACRFALGASVFGAHERAVSYAREVSAGCVTINDVLVATADPRVSFGGWNASGYGVTRGLEGLREMTRLKVVCERRGRWLPHLSTDVARVGPLMLGLLLMRYGGSMSRRWTGWKTLIKAMRTPDLQSNHEDIKKRK